MGSSLKFWVKAIVLDSLFIGALLAGEAFDLQLVLNVALFVGWVVAVCQIAMHFFWSEAEKVLNASAKDWSLHRSRAWRLYDNATDVAVVALLAGLGHFALAAAFLIGSILLFKPRIRQWQDAQGGTHE